jgi:hypothetical protein
LSRGCRWCCRRRQRGPTRERSHKCTKRMSSKCSQPFGVIGLPLLRLIISRSAWLHQATKRERGGSTAADTHRLSSSSTTLPAPERRTGGAGVAGPGTTTGPTVDAGPKLNLTVVRIAAVGACSKAGLASTGLNPGSTSVAVSASTTGEQLFRLTPGGGNAARGIREDGPAGWVDASLLRPRGMGSELARLATSPASTPCQGDASTGSDRSETQCFVCGVVGTARCAAGGSMVGI